MKILDFSNAVAPLRQPVLSESLTFIQDSYKEIVSELFKSIYGSDPGASVLNIRGGIASGLSGSITWTAGCFYYNGELFITDGGSVTISGGQVPVWKIATTYEAYDPITFKGAIPAPSYNVHGTRKFVLVSGPSGLSLIHI